jgi:NitT/TauT family transport system ATP-binding protein
MSAISVRNLWMDYPGQRVLERVNLEVPSGQFVAIVGASGCGKSTFLRLILSQEKPTRGTILLDGQKLPDDPGPDRGVVFQRYSVFPHLTVVKNVVLGLEIAAAPLTGKLFGAARRRAVAQAEGYLDEVGLAAARERYPAELSGGMQQRLAIAQALVRRPKVLLLDEPFGALDPGTRADMHELILKLWRECAMTVFLVTHDIKEGFALGTRVLVFDKVRNDPQDPSAYGATITYDLPLAEGKHAIPILTAEATHVPAKEIDRASAPRP